VSYIDGFVIAVPTANKQRFIEHAGMAKLMEMMNDPSKLDPPMDPEKNPMPFDGKRLIFGGFAPVVSLQK